jgi:sec-independent protein translocase protein TatC
MGCPRRTPVPAGICISRLSGLEDGDCRRAGKLFLGRGLSDQPPAEEYEEGGPGEAAPAPGKKVMGFLDHLEDLRWTLIKSAVVFALFVTLIAYYVDDFGAVLSRPLTQVKADYPAMNTELITNSPMGVFSVIIDICLIGGLVLSLPFILFFFGQFIAPALTKRETKVLLPTCVSALLLFLGGAAFGYFLLTPSTIRVAYELNKMMHYTVMWTADRYYSLLIWLVLGMGAAFEFPLLIVLAVYMGLIEVATLRKYRRHAIVVIFIIAAVITPTPDPINQSLFAVPLILLYEVAILVASQLKDEIIEA